MSITDVVVNYTARNYFNDYDETRSDRMTWVEPEKVSKAIDKLVMRYRNSQECDCMFVKNDDDTGWRLMYGYDEGRFDPKTSKRTLRLRHYTVYSVDGWDTEETVSVARAKECILGDYDVAMERTPIFSGTAYEYVERFGNGENK